MEKIVILGKGGHAHSVADVIERQGKYQIVGYVINEEMVIQETEDYPIMGNDECLVSLYNEGIRCAAIGIGYLGKGTLRQELYAKLKEIGYRLPILCDPSAILSSKVKINEGTFIGKGAIINRGVTIGKACIINSGSIIEHDCRVGDFSHISVGTALCGDVNVGTEVLIGANATVIQGRSIGNRCIVGAGEIVKKNVCTNTMYYDDAFLVRNK